VGPPVLEDEMTRDEGCSANLVLSLLLFIVTKYLGALRSLFTGDQRRRAERMIVVSLGDENALS